MTYWSSIEGKIKVRQQTNSMTDQLEKQKKAVLLSRVSTTEQKETGESLSAQERKGREYADRNGFEIVKEFTFSESAGDKIRTNFLEMLQYLKTNKDVKIVITPTVDRITRNFKDAVDLDEMRKKDEIEIHFVQDGFILKKESTGNDMFMWETKVYLAKQYLNRLSDDVKRTMKQKILNKEWFGKAPVGYKNITVEEKDPNNKEGKKEKKWIIPDEKKAPIIKMLFQEYAKGTTSMEILRGKAKELGITQSRGQILKILTNPFYYGEMKYKGKLYPHNYVPIISKELFDQVQSVRQGHNKKSFKFAAKLLLFRNKIKCACGCAVSFDRKEKYYKTTKRRATYIYGRCTNYYGKHKKIVRVKEEEMVDQIAKQLKGMFILEKALTYIKDELNKSHEDKKVFHESAMANLKAEHERIQRKVERLYDDRLDGRILTGEYDERVKVFKDKQIEILKQMELHDKADKSYYIQLGKVVELASRACELFRGSKLEKKRRLLEYLVSDLTLNGKKLQINYQKPFDSILHFASRSQYLPLGLEVRTCVYKDKPYVFRKVA